MQIKLNGLEDSRALGRILARELAAAAPMLFLLQGALGAGKTTLTRFLVNALPGSEGAEVTSPSFTLCNIYPTSPRVQHFDLYRLETGQGEENLEETLDTLDQSGDLVIIEWPERFPADYFPPDLLHCSLTGSENNRRALFYAGGKARPLLETIGQKAALSGLTLIRT